MRDTCLISGVMVCEKLAFRLLKKFPVELGVLAIALLYTKVSFIFLDDRLVV